MGTHQKEFQSISNELYEKAYDLDSSDITIATPISANPTSISRDKDLEVFFNFSAKSIIGIRKSLKQPKLAKFSKSSTDALARIKDISSILFDKFSIFNDKKQAKKNGNHLLFEKWRNRDIDKLTKDEAKEYESDLETSAKRYQDAWDKYLLITNQSDSAARASWTNLATSLESLTRSKLSFKSSAVQTPERQTPSSLTAPKPSSSTITRPSDLSNDANINNDFKSINTNNNTKNQGKKAEIDKEIDDTWAEFLNVGKGRLYSGGIDPEILAVGTKLVALYIKKGVYELSAILVDAKDKLGERFKDFFDAIKQSYAAYYITGPDNETENMTDLKEGKKNKH